MQNVYVIWIHTYNLECLEYCLSTFDDRTDYTAIPYHHLIIDSSIGQQEEVRTWVAEKNKTRRSHPDKPPIEIHFCNEHLGPTSKKNIAFSLVKDKCDFVVEMEDDVTIHGKTSSWLKAATDGISNIENQGHRLYFDFNAGIHLNEYSCTGTILSCSTRSFVGDYPSQISGSFINPVEELILFPRYLKKHLFIDKGLKRIGFPGEIWFEFDLASISSNYIIEFRKILAEKSLNDLISVQEYTHIYTELYNKFLTDPRPPRIVFENTNLKSHECIEKFLRLKNKSHLLLTILEYRKYERSICLIPEEFALFQKEFRNNPEALELLINQKAIMEEDGLVLINSLDKDIINLKESLPEAFRVLIKYAK